MTLFTPLNLGSIPLANRLVRSATGEGAATRDLGRPTRAMASFYGRLASGGVGLVVTGHTAVSYEGRCSERMTAFHCDEFGPGFERLVRACHDAGVPVVCQLNHGGRQVNPQHRGIRAWCPSAVQAAGAAFVPEALPEPQIERIIAAFGQAAGRCRRAGFDGVQIHSAHGYLVSQFNSPLTNRRQDAWGGSFDNRTRFLSRVYQSLRQAVGPDYPILVKQNVSDFHPEGLSQADALAICHQLDQMGVAAIELSGGIGETIARAFRAEAIRREGEAVFFETQARAIRRAVACPLILTGGIRTVATAERLLREGVCDGIGLCRPLLREPDLPRQWQRGTKAGADCISCGRCQSSPQRCNFCPHLEPLADVRGQDR
jgi:2,4-dienoyl-CoA reductase-like NADH-dependent reductase (Old Yellow Enzyme family)